MGHEIGKKSRVVAGTTALVAAAGLAGVGLSHAAGSPVLDVPTLVGAGSSSVVACAADALSITPSLDYDADARDYLIHEVTVGGIPSDCLGQRLRVTLDSQVEGSAPVEIEATVTGPTAVLPVPVAQRASVGELTVLAAVIAY